MFRIAAFFAKGKSAEDNAAFLRREFLSGKYGHSEQPSGKGFGFTVDPRVLPYGIRCEKG